MPACPLWSALPSNQIRSWDDGFAVVYSGACGDTHLLTPLAGETLRLLMQKARTLECLLQDMADIFENQSRDQALGIIENILFELQKRHLVVDDPN